MENIDLQYLCTVIGNLSGIPIRLYRGNVPEFCHSLVRLPRDPIGVYIADIRNIQTNVGYFVTKHFNYYGIVNAKDVKIIIGPTRQTENTTQELRELAFRADVPAEETDDFVNAMKSIVRMPLESIMQILCTMNYILNGEKLSLHDIAIYDTQEPSFFQQPMPHGTADMSRPHNLHNTFELEQTVMNIVRKGDSAALQEWTASAPAVRGGILADEQLRQLKNTFIVTTTLASRAAIRGGMDIDDAFTLSDAFIQKCELISAPDKIINLQYQMVTEFTRRVEMIRLGKQPSKLAIDVANYIQHHLSEPITAEDIAKELYLSRPYLSRKFIEETGISLTDYILNEKTEEAKRLLRYSDKSLTAISGYLGFSSQSHFSRVFKKYSGSTPGEYREKFTV
ncbi:MAG: helix-turn-helix domain-containing protein [Oscillospiraceae bacterium]|nr:helix-turn-helix domain-containing protein [Oscillospiraceae bacterium]